MKPEDALKLFFPLVSLAGSFFQLLAQLRPQFAWKRQAYAEVGDLGRWYRIIITGPLMLLSAALAAVFGLSLVAIVTGARLATGFSVGPSLARVFELSPFIFVAYVILFPLVALNLIQELVLWLSKMFDAVRFRVGWINARWQLRHHRQFFAMNVKDDRCDELATLIFADARVNRAALLPYQAPQPAALSGDELAAYLLVGCAIESRLRQVPAAERSPLNAVWQTLAQVATLPEHPFAPASLTESASTARGFYASLRQTTPGAALPDSPLVKESVDRACRRLVAKFRGRGTALGRGRFLNRSSSPASLLSRLEKFERYSESESIRRLFLKLAVRMKVWPSMAPGPFLFPFNFWIASLLLRSGCVVVPSDAKVVEASAELTAMFAEAEDHVAGAVFRMIQQSADEPLTRTFVEAVFGIPVGDLSRWSVSDYVDLWLFGQTRNYCAQRTATSTAATLGCPLKTHDTSCFCDSAQLLWKPANGRLVS